MMAVQFDFSGDQAIGVPRHSVLQVPISRSHPRSPHWESHLQSCWPPALVWLPVSLVDAGPPATKAGAPFLALDPWPCAQQRLQNGMFWICPPSASQKWPLQGRCPSPAICAPRPVPLETVGSGLEIFAWVLEIMSEFLPKGDWTF